MSFLFLLLPVLMIFGAADFRDVPAYLSLVLFFPFLFLSALLIGLFALAKTAGPRACVVKGAALAQRNPKRALIYFQAAAFSPEFRSTLLSVCVELMQAGEQKLAIEIAEHLTRVAPKEADNWCGLSYLNYHSGRQTESFRYLDEALRLEPKNAEIYYNRAVRRSEDEKGYEQSLKDYTKAISLDGSQARYYANRGALYNRMGRHESALADAKKAHQLDPRDRVAGNHAAIALESLGRDQEIEDWMQGGASALADLLRGAGQDTDFQAALSQHLQNGDASALKANYPGETITVIGPNGTETLSVDDL